MLLLNSVSKEFVSGRRRIKVLQEISFLAEQGEIIALRGKSGSGKTTLLNCCCGLETPDSGTVQCCGIELSCLSNRQLSQFLRTQTGFVFQQGNLLSYLTVKENISLPLVLNKKESHEIEKRVADLLEHIQLSDAAHALPTELSGGETIRVAIARGLAHSPSIFFADEPTASLDSQTAKSVIQLIKSLSTLQGSTVIFSTHDNELLSMADKVIELRDGQLLAKDRSGSDLYF